ncbi:hypothetical protein O181_045146 [Austropuccinia psidii MF-1]|uniref:Retrovirus-related Pol polyprotein from transposon TNT 1-94 n=1 Tax=Austropuccinia psidii MF-1 TaxID=1389203 RepID=A0A9Q3DRS2_9BASI|nr:hypothetical protein [Austropuccinia psidii MF-1]
MIVADNWDCKEDYNSPLPEKCDLTTLADNDDIIHQSDFISAIGALRYVVISTCPNIAFAINMLARNSKPLGQPHWECLQHILGYLNKMQYHDWVD